jgi:hypothetical protein
MDMDVKPNAANQELHAYTVLQQHTKMTGVTLDIVTLDRHEEISQCDMNFSP